MRFLVDAQLPPALARWLTASGLSAEHVSDRGMHDACDAAFWKFALEAHAVIVIKDEDSAQRKMLADTGPVVGTSWECNTTVNVHTQSRRLHTIPCRPCERIARAAT